MQHGVLDNDIASEYYWHDPMRPPHSVALRFTPDFPSYLVRLLPVLTSGVEAELIDIGVKTLSR